QMQSGVDLVRVSGQVISQPICERERNTCVQWSSKQRYEFPNDAMTASEVKRAPLGLWKAQPQIEYEKPAPPQGNTVNPFLLVAVSVVALFLAGQSDLLYYATPFQHPQSFDDTARAALRFPWWQEPEPVSLEGQPSLLAA